MLLGQYHAKVEAKKRIAFPAKLREESGDRLILTYGFEECVMIVPYHNWESLMNEWKHESFLLPEVRDIELFLFGGAAEVTLDHQGRFILPPHLKEFGHIDKEIVIVGTRNYARLWSAKIWNDYWTMNTLQIREKARRLGERLGKEAK